MSNRLDVPSSPALPIASREYDSRVVEQKDNALRLFFRRLEGALRGLVDPVAGGAVLYLPGLAAHSLVDQTLGAINTATAATFAVSRGVSASLVTSSRLGVTKAGEFLVSGVLSVGTSGSTAHSVTVWLRKNGTDVAGTGQTVPIIQRTSVAFADMVSMDVDDYIEVMWAAGSTDIFLDSVAASSPYPAIPSLRVSMTFAGNV